MGWLDRLGLDSKSSDQKHAESLNKKAIDCIGRGQLERAEKLLQEAIQLAPDTAAAHHNLGAVYLNQKRYSQALKQMQRALKLEPHEVETRIAIAKIHADMGKADQSLAEYQQLCADQPEDWRSQISLGNALLERGRLDEAIEHLEKAAHLKPKEELTHLVLAVAYERRGDLERAIKEYRCVRNMTRVRQNRSAASQKMRELQGRQADERRSPEIRDWSGDS